MTLVASIAPQLPLLRRYARALTGRQDVGDRQVAAMLEALVLGNARLDEAVAPRLAIFRLFSVLWNSAPVPLVPGSDPDRTIADQRIGTMTPLPRQAFLLTALEAFTPVEAAYVLGVDSAAIAALIAEAGRQIGAQMVTRVLVIEDEPIIAMELESLIESLGHTVVGIARTHRDALRIAAHERPGLVVADVRLADGSSGLEAVDEILHSIDVPVIFITAFPEYLLTGHRPEPAFLVTKPFSSGMVRAVVSQALFFDSRPRAVTAASA